MGDADIGREPWVRELAEYLCAAYKAYRHGIPIQQAHRRYVEGRPVDDEWHALAQSCSREIRDRTFAAVSSPEMRERRFADSEPGRTGSGILRRVSPDGAAQEGRYEQGFEQGKTWGRRAASLEDLDLLDKTFGRNPPWDLPGTWGDDGPGGAFFSTMHPRLEGNRVACEVFWEEHAGFSQPSEDFVRGFVDGALLVYEELRPR